MEIKIQETEKQIAKKVVGTQISQTMYDQLKEEAEEAFLRLKIPTQDLLQEADDNFPEWEQRGVVPRIGPGDRLRRAAA